MPHPLSAKYNINPPRNDGSLTKQGKTSYYYKLTGKDIQLSSASISGVINQLCYGTK